jgi:CRP-like cAMP-binding protein
MRIVVNQLSLVDLLSLSPEAQAVVRLLTRQPERSLSEVVRSTGFSRAQSEAVISAMVNKRQLVEKLNGNERTFSVRYQFSRSRVKSLPSSIQAFLAQPADTFLGEVPLTAVLSPAERQELLAESATHWLQPREVFAWQGRTVNMVGLLRQGLLEQIDLDNPQKTHERQYVTAGQWIGLEEMLSATPSGYTFTAVTDCELLLWPSATFASFVQSNVNLSWELSHYFNQRLLECRRKCGHHAGLIWTIEGMTSGTAVSLLASNLAFQAATAAHPPRLLLWHIDPAQSQNDGFYHRLQSDVLPFRLASGLESSDYPPEVQLNLFLKQAQSKYDLIICDTGVGQGLAWLEHLRAQARTRLVVSQDANGAAAIQARWRETPNALPGQKRLALLSSPQLPDVPDPAFQFVLREVEAPDGYKIVRIAPEHSYAKAVSEIHRRISLNHAVAIFVPSTVDVDQEVDNSQQVQSTLAFLGTVFGGATRSDGEGVWRAEDDNLVTEAVTIVRTFVTKQALDQHLDDVIDFATGLKHEMKQEAVAIDVDNHLILV